MSLREGGYNYSEKGVKMRGGGPREAAYAGVEVAKYHELGTWAPSVSR